MIIFLIIMQLESEKMNERRKKELQEMLDHAIKFCNGTLKMNIRVNNQEEADFVRSKMKRRKKVKNIGVVFDEETG